MKNSVCLLALLALTGCATNDKLDKPSKYSSTICEKAFHEVDTMETSQQLDKVSELFELACYDETIHLASYLRVQNRDKFYAFSAELMEVFTPEGTFTPYVLESYERSLLSLYISLSYLNLQKTEAAMVELRRVSQEERAQLYNFGNDPAVTLLLAALWDRFDPTMARPYWKSLHENKKQAQEIRKFASARLEAIDLKNERISWNIYGMGQLPDLDWEAQFFKKVPYKITTKSEYPRSCSTENSLLLPTKSWTDKIAIRYKSDYHPLVYAKSLVRFPIGVTYGIVGVSSGVAIGVGGCVAAAQATDSGSAELCQTSLVAGAFLIQQTGNFVDYTLRPDMRHWAKLPRAILVSRPNQSPKPEKMCGSDLGYLQTTLAAAN